MASDRELDVPGKGGEPAMLGGGGVGWGGGKGKGREERVGAAVLC